MVTATVVSGPFKGVIIVSVLLVSATTSSAPYASDKLMVEYPRVVPGETEVGMRGLVQFDSRDDLNNAQTWKFGAGHGFNDYWFSEVYLETEKPAGESDYKAEFLEWENLFRLTEPGRYWADWGVILEYSRAIEEEEQDAYKFMPLIQKRFSREMITLNLAFDRNQAENGTNRWQFSYGWQYLWLGNPAFQFALEGYGQLGDLADWAPVDDQIHRIGPALLGKFRTGPGRGWDYRSGIFLGLTKESPDTSLVASIEYEFF